jgi:peptidoglycan/LPS O-acetylase OafA/YrhL
MLHYGINLPFYNDTMGRGVSAFFVGVVLYKIWKNNNSAKVTTVSIIALAIVILTYKFEYNLYADGQRGVLTYIAFPSLIILLSNIDSIIPRVLGKIFVFLGGVSYEMFLWHFPGILLIDFLNRGRFMIDRNSPKTMLIFLLVVISFSTIEYLFIEKPIGKKLSGSR